MLYTTSDLLKQHEHTAASAKVAVIVGQRRIAYGELLERSRSYAALFKEGGLQKGDRVATFLPRSIEAVIALFATHFAGGVAVIINETLRARQVQYILEHSEASFLVTDTRQLLSLADHPLRERRALNVVNMDEARPHAGPLFPERIIGADLALLIYTSGSTGMPKGVMLSHHNLLSGAQIVSDYLNLTERDIIISLLPFSFDYGLNQLLTAFLVGGTLVIQRSLFPPDICRTLQLEKVTGMAGVPTLWLQLVQRHSPLAKMNFPHLRYVTNSGGRLPEQVVRLLRTSHPQVQIYLMYGLTEAFRSTFLPPEEVDRRPSSIGKAIPNVEIFLINERGEACKPGEVGMLVHRGANVALGYWRDPRGTAEVFRPHPFDGSRNGHPETVVFSGDLVRSDAEGYLYFVGRKDQAIKSRGFRASPEEIERCIAASDLVANVVAFAISNDGMDSEIIAAVTPPDGSPFDEGPLVEFCKKEMPEYMWPSQIWRVDEFPLTTSGKPDRPRLKAIYVEQQAARGTSRTAGTT